MLEGLKSRPGSKFCHLGLSFSKNYYVTCIIYPTNFKRNFKFYGSNNTYSTIIQWLPPKMIQSILQKFCNRITLLCTEMQSPLYGMECSSCLSAHRNSAGQFRAGSKVEFCLQIKLQQEFRKAKRHCSNQNQAKTSELIYTSCIKQHLHLIQRRASATAPCPLLSCWVQY